MNEIDYPYLTQEQHQLLTGKQKSNQSFKSWLIGVGMGVVGLIAGHYMKPPTEPVSASSGFIAIDPRATHCTSRPELSQAGWKRVSEVDKQRIAGDKHNRLIEAQTLTCEYDGKTFELREWWYERERLPWRRLAISD